MPMRIDEILQKADAVFAWGKTFKFFQLKSRKIHSKFEKHFLRKRPE